MKNKLSYAAAVTALLLAGAGCAAKPQAELETKTPVPETATERKAEMKPEGGVDATIDGLLKDVEAEAQMQKEQESDASELESDKAELNAYSEGSYEVK